MIEQYIQRLDQFLIQLIERLPIPAQSIREAMHYTLFSGGKRIRPLLIYLSGELFTLPLAMLDIIAASIELTHCYSLIHDDLPAMDNDDVRRGKPSCHKAFDEATAILVGDGLQALAIEILLTDLPTFLSPAAILQITQCLVQASGISGMVSGQCLDLAELSQTTLSEQRLQTIHELKTGRLIAACLDMVLAAYGQADQLKQQALKTYGQHIGLVFQLQDDYLDHYAPEVLGKDRASDKANQKTTYATLFSQQELERHIAHHYLQAQHALTSFGSKAQSLITLTQELEQRSQIILSVS